MGQVWSSSPPPKNGCVLLLPSPAISVAIRARHISALSSARDLPVSWGLLGSPARRTTPPQGIPEGILGVQRRRIVSVAWWKLQHKRSGHVLYYTYSILYYIKSYHIILNLYHIVLNYIILYYIIKGSWEAILPCCGQIEFWDLKWWRVVRHLTIHNKRIRSYAVDLDEGW